MVEKKCLFFGKIFYTTLLVSVVLMSFVISSCEKEKAPEVDPNTLPVAKFYCTVQYITLDDYDANTYASVTVTNSSAYSNRWKWSRPGSIEKLDSKKDTTLNGLPIIRPITFETKKQDTIIKQFYLATTKEQRFKITLIAYSDMPIGLNPDSTVIYRTFESHPFVQEFAVKKPE